MSRVRIEKVDNGYIIHMELRAIGSSTEVFPTMEALFQRALEYFDYLEGHVTVTWGRPSTPDNPALSPQDVEEMMEAVDERRESTRCSTPDGEGGKS